MISMSNDWNMYEEMEHIKILPIEPSITFTRVKYNQYGGATHECLGMMEMHYFPFWSVDKLRKTLIEDIEKKILNTMVQDAKDEVIGIINKRFGMQGKIKKGGKIDGDDF